MSKQKNPDRRVSLWRLVIKSSTFITGSGITNILGRIISFEKSAGQPDGPLRFGTRRRGSIVQAISEQKLGRFLKFLVDVFNSKSCRLHLCYVRILAGMLGMFSGEYFVYPARPLRRGARNILHCFFTLSYTLPSPKLCCVLCRLKLTLAVKAF